MSVEFDSACCTAQQEDSLQLYIRNPASQQPRNLASPLVTSQSANTSLVKSQKYSPVLNKFSGKTNWPSHGVVLPGNVILFSRLPAVTSARTRTRTASRTSNMSWHTLEVCVPQV